MGIPLAWVRDVGEPSPYDLVAVERAAGTGADGAPDGRVISAHAPHLVEPLVSGSLADLPFRNAEEAPCAAVFARRSGIGTGSGSGYGTGSGSGPEGGWQDVTAAEFAAQVTDVAKGLIQAGVGLGDRVAIMSRTRFEWTLLDFAAWAAGAVVVPLYPTASAEQVAWALRDSGVRVVVAENEACARVVEEALNYSSVLFEAPRVWRFDEGAIEELMMRGGGVPDDELARRRGTLSPESPATITYTSGTTGMPKGVSLTHGNFMAAAANCGALLSLFRSPPEEPARTLLFLPLAHVLCRVVQVACVQARVQVGHSPSMRPGELRPDIESFGATFLVGVPYIFEKIHQFGRAEARGRHLGPVYQRATRTAVRYGAAMLRAQAGEGPGPSLPLRAVHSLYDVLVYRQVRKALGGRISEAISGGSALSPELLLFFEGAGVRIYEGYGLTETTGPATVNPPSRPRPGTVGPPLPGTTVRIADDGEVLLRGPQVFRGYERGKGAPHDESGTGDSGGPTGAPSEDGWFATGDLGHLDAAGYLTITGRKKDILITFGGKNVSPGPLEDQLRAHPVISQCIVVGDGRPFVGALVTLDPQVLMLESLLRRGGTPPTASGDTFGVDDAPDPGADVEPDADLGADSGTDGPVEVQTAMPVPAELVAEVVAAVAEVNRSVSRAESIRRVRIVDGDFTLEDGLLSASLKVKRRAVLEAYEDDVEALYSYFGPAQPRLS